MKILLFGASGAAGGAVLQAWEAFRERVALLYEQDALTTLGVEVRNEGLDKAIRAT